MKQKVDVAFFDATPDSIEELLSMARSAGSSSGYQLTGVKGLMLAVLEEGVRTFLNNSSENREQIRARNWIASSEHHDCSFVTLCELFGVEPSAARWALMKLRAEGKKAPTRIRARKPREVPSITVLRKRGDRRKPSRWTGNG